LLYFSTVVPLETQVHFKLLQQVIFTDFKYYIHALVTISTAEENPSSIQPIILHWKNNAELWSNVLIYLKTKQNLPTKTKQKKTDRHPVTTKKNPAWVFIKAVEHQAIK